MYLSRFISAIIVVILALSFHSCEREKLNPHEDQIVEEALHNDFLPLYPHSQWIYLNKEGLKDTFYTLDYEKTVKNYPPIDSSKIIITTSLYHKYQPFLPAVNGYTSYIWPGPYKTDFLKVLSETVGDVWPSNHYDPRIHMNGDFKTTIFQEGDLLKVKEFNSAIQQEASYNDSIVYEEIYERYIGLTRKSRINTNTSDTLIILDLIEYYISR